MVNNIKYLRYIVLTLCMTIVSACSATDVQNSSKQQSQKCSLVEKYQPDKATMCHAIFEDVVIQTIQKTDCPKLLERNFADYKLCSDWSIQPSDLKKIIQLSRIEPNPNVYLSYDNNAFYYSSKVTVGSKPYFLRIYPTGIIFISESLVDNDDSESFLGLACELDNCKKYFYEPFLGESIEDSSQELFSVLKQKTRPNVKLTKLDLSKYKFPTNQERCFKGDNECYVFHHAGTDFIYDENSNFLSKTSKQPDKLKRDKQVKIIFYNEKSDSFTSLNMKASKTSPLKDSLNLLLSGPPEEQQINGLTDSSLGIKQFSVKIKDNTAFINFIAPKDYKNLTNQSLDNFEYTVIETAKQFDTVNNVEICLDGMRNYKMVLLSNEEVVPCR